MPRAAAGSQAQPPCSSLCRTSTTTSPSSPRVSPSPWALAGWGGSQGGAWRPFTSPSTPEWAYIRDAFPLLPVSTHTPKAAHLACQDALLGHQQVTLPVVCHVPRVPLPDRTSFTRSHDLRKTHEPGSRGSAERQSQGWALTHPQTGSPHRKMSNKSSSHALGGLGRKVRQMAHHLHLQG